MDFQDGAELSTFNIGGEYLVLLVYYKIISKLGYQNNKILLANLSLIYILLTLLMFKMNI